ncbi:MAG: hypothetical protein M0Q88_02760 [Bacilli bacterium]|nr:hypothetical protein [Bacilli bacterium]
MIENNGVIIINENENLQDLEKKEVNSVEEKEDGENKERATLPFEVEFTFDIVNPEYINTLEKYNEIKSNILKANYACLALSEKNLNIVTENGYFYIIDISVIELSEISNLLIFRKPKKVFVGIDEYSGLINENSTNFWDLGFIYKLLFGIKIKDAKEVLKIAKVPYKGRKNTYLFCVNLINIAKAINVYVEKNKLNSKLILEIDIFKKAVLFNKKGFPINVDKYNSFKNDLINKYDILIKEKKNKYGESFDFNDLQSMFAYLSNKDKIPSLEPSILALEDKELLDDINIFNSYNEALQHKIEHNNFIIRYDTFDDYQIKAEYKPNEIYLDENALLVEGKFIDLYYRVLTELTKDKNLIKATSTNKFLDYINENILGNSELGIYTEIFIRGYANECFNVELLQSFAGSYYKTIISDGDALYIDNLFKNKAPELIDFFINFDGMDVTYERYNKKIFNPYSNLDGYIKQIMNLIFKTAISLTMAAINEYVNKYKKDDTMDIEIIGFYENSIILKTTHKSRATAIDILNRYMSLAYKKFIRNTKYYNLTGDIKS